MNTEYLPEPETNSEAQPEVSSFRYAAPPKSRSKALFRTTFASALFGFLIGAVLVGIILVNTSAGIQSLRQKLHISTPSGGSPIIQQQLTVQESSAIITASKKVAPSVVAITASQQVADFYGQSSSQEESSGSGFIITSDGLILTNKHVVSDATASYKVVLDDGRVFDGKIQATDPLNDLAVIKIDATNLPTVSFGSSDALQVGQSVLAIGNALGQFQNSVTSGIISAKGRQISPQSDDGSSTTENLTDLLQTDAAINPGNSGGPLVNLDGQVVGIDTAIASTTGGSVGIGFAIPVDDFKAVVSSVEKTGTITVPYLGVRYQQIDATDKQVYNLSVDYGAWITADVRQNQAAVLPGGPADKAGLLTNDILLQMDGTKIDATNTLQRLLEQHQPNDVVTFTVLRSAKQITIKVTLGSQS